MKGLEHLINIKNINLRHNLIPKDLLDEFVNTSDYVQYCKDGTIPKYS